MTDSTSPAVLRRFPLIARLWTSILRYAVKFGVVGLVGLVVDVGIFNLLRVAFDDGQWFGTPLGAKVVSTSVAILVNWVGNRFWTFRQHRRSDVVSEFIEYILVSAGGMAIALGCLWVSHHLLGYRSLLADNIASNVVGLGLGTLFRFALYRYWVYGNGRSGRRRPEAAHDLTGELALIESDRAATQGSPTVTGTTAAPRSARARSLDTSDLPAAPTSGAAERERHWN